MHLGNNSISGIPSPPIQIDKRMKNIILTVAVASVQKWSKEHKGPSLLCKCPR